jgi:hypothetical protein
MLKVDFETETKDIVKRALKGKFPARTTRPKT